MDGLLKCIDGLKKTVQKCKFLDGFDQRRSKM
jgi:hypothetical protein